MANHGANDEVRAFGHPGKGKERARAVPKGRQIDPAAALEIAELLGARPRSRDLLIEHLHLIQDRWHRISAAHLAALADVVIVEGAGGFMVPLSATRDSADLARHLGLPIILVVGMRLGCLNHALLTAEAIAARGLHLTGWVANRVQPEMAAFDENLAALNLRLPGPLLAELPYVEQPDAEAMATWFAPKKLARLLEKGV